MEETSRYPELIQQGQIIKAEYTILAGVDEGNVYTELFMTAHISPNEFILINLSTGNRWNDPFPALKGTEIVASAKDVIKNLHSSPMSKLTNVEVLGHISEVDFFNQLG